MLDTRLYVQTPEGIELTLTPAGLLPRCLALFVDYTILIVASLVISRIAIIFFQDFAWAAILIFWFLSKWCYDILFEVFNRGKTPGKALLGVRVVSGNGAPIAFTASALRNLLRVIDIFPIFYLVGTISVLSTQAFQRLGDIVAGTYVVYIDKDQDMVRTTNANERPLQLNLKAKDHEAIMLFEERIEDLSQSRRDEIAGLLSDHIEGTPSQIYAKLKAHARWLVGTQS